jgi:enterochelin esterase-like enzyme/SAM-dependent methyltransferase
MDTHEIVTSPRLISLREELAEGKLTALDNFWQEIAASSAPLVEPIPGNERDRLVTFLCRNDKDGVKIGLVSNLLGKMGEYEEMLHFPNTDVWYKTHQLPKSTRETYQFSIDGQNSVDQLNPRMQSFPLDEDTGIGGWESSIFELPDAPPQPWSRPLQGVPTGEVVKHYLRSEILGNKYPVWIYTPPGYSPDEEPYGFLLLLDGWFYVSMIPAATILDNLQAEGKLPPLVAIMIGSLSYGEVRKRDYGCYPLYIEFLTKELLPWVRQKVHLTGDPSQTAIVGASRGGLMAGYIALHLPGIFGNVLSQSGSFGWKPAEDNEQEWLARQYVVSPSLPLRFYLEAGLFETDLMMVDGYAINLLASNRHLRDVLQAKGYPVHYQEFSGGHSSVIWRGTLADGLLALLGKGAGSDMNQDETVQSTPKPSNRTIQSLSRAVHPSFAMLAGCQLGVFTALRDVSLTADQVAQALEVDVTRLRPLLYALVSAGLLAVEQEHFSNTAETNSFLAKGSPYFMGTVYDVWAMIWEAEMKTAESIRTGVAQCWNLFDYANKPREELAKMFRGFHAPSMAYGRLLAERYDFSLYQSIVDVGGGSGGLAIALVQTIPHLIATVIDLPSVTPITQQFIDEAGLADRIQTKALNVVNEQISGSYDVAILSKIIQTLSAEDSRLLLKNVGQALSPGGKVIIFGTILDDSRLTPADFATANLFFINVYDGGQAFTEGEHREWLAEAGFENIERTILPDQVSLITADRK